VSGLSAFAAGSSPFRQEWQQNWQQRVPLGAAHQCESCGRDDALSLFNLSLSQDFDATEVVCPFTSQLKAAITHYGIQ